MVAAVSKKKNKNSHYVKCWLILFCISLTKHRTYTVSSHRLTSSDTYGDNSTYSYWYSTLRVIMSLKSQEIIHMWSTLIFARIIGFMLFNVLLLIMYFISKNYEFTIHVASLLFKEWLTKSVGPVIFSTKYLICTHVQTDGQIDGRTDKLIQVGLDKTCWFLQVNNSTWRRIM
jgi:hypothetical protein